MKKKRIEELLTSGMKAKEISVLINCNLVYVYKIRSSIKKNTAEVSVPIF